MNNQSVIESKPFESAQSRDNSVFASLVSATGADASVLLLALSIAEDSVARAAHRAAGASDDPTQACLLEALALHAGLTAIQLGPTDRSRVDGTLEHELAWSLCLVEEIEARAWAAGLAVVVAHCQQWRHQRWELVDACLVAGC